MLGLLKRYLDDLYIVTDSESDSDKDESEEDDEDKGLEEKKQKGKNEAKDETKDSKGKTVGNAAEAPPADDLNTVVYFSSDDSYDEDERPVRRMPWREQANDH